MTAPATVTPTAMTSSPCGAASGAGRERSARLMTDVIARDSAGDCRFAAHSRALSRKAGSAAMMSPHCSIAIGTMTKASATVVARNVP